ncbi:MAG TPA: malto-oligosyltrehalose synthase [Candidatus Dormibacteraeota bacterium]
MAPLATYRLQLTPDFGFDRAAAVAPYLARLGVSHLYSSPQLQAVAGSTHGYDVVDPSRVSFDLGGEAGHARLLEALRAAGLGQVLDIVPNHMAIGGRANRWWWDVLENGASSRFATYFDVAWEPPEPRLRHLILVPVLADHYGRVLDRGELRLHLDEQGFSVRYFEHEFPVSPTSIDSLLEAAAKRASSLELESLAEAVRELPDLQPGDPQAEERNRRREEIMQRFQTVREARPEVREALEGVVRWANGSADRLDGLLDRQHYRLARWQMALQDIDYRRFFDIDTLAAIRVEDPVVFDATHRLVLEWIDQGVLDGLRIDHADGLRDPEAYLRRLRERAPKAWVVVEKILHPGERLPPWPVAGTTGYDFMNRVLGLFVDRAGERPLTRAYQHFTGIPDSYPEVAYQSKLRAIDELLAADLNRLANILVSVSDDNRSFRDFTRHELREAVRQLLACFPVYRTYIRPDQLQVSDSDRLFVEEAVAEARRRRPDLDGELFEFIGDVLGLEHTGLPESEFVQRFQQTTGPVTAKGVEDTAFYVYNRLVCLNEVGGDPDTFGTTLEEFHRACRETADEWPETMLSTSSHDTKRSEDVRARLALLSEIPEAWLEAVLRWSRHNDRHRRGDLPDRNAEYLLYQVLVGAHPLPVDRAVAYMEKASKEAKVHTSWVAHNPEYDAALRAFVEGVLGDEAFVADLAAFVRPLVLPGWMTSLSMKLIALTAPGVPDVYQGTELWDLSLVDPDNRRPVDFELRQRLLDELPGIDAEAAWRRLEEGVPKLLVVQRALQLRRQRPEAFAGGYHPLPVRGARAEHLVAFARADSVVTLAPRLLIGLVGGWADTVVELPDGHWRDVMTGREFEGGEVAVDHVLDEFPVGLLVR